MSFLGFGRPQPTSAEKIAAVENELKVVAEMHSRMVKICTLKCIDKTYREGELAKGEAVCLDRCAAKFFEAHQKISDQLQKETQAQQAGRGGGFGMQ
ncbi:mitochondrial import inner membrane translocase subunit tim-10 [Diplogelasinospora grovesii]|uniref:Mitochondrial import inner membrane translocase subunit n=1 Tax=Diplogelasinospora grovesii TaxID=303347 RepID=A0AAN6S3W9_9PEZI|nr:mitochondrial import inner membrane translocase subunit tim-10 [Diplogelasinospora grovesii]